MKAEQKKIARLLRVFADAVENATIEEVEAALKPLVLRNAVPKNRDNPKGNKSTESVKIYKILSLLSKARTKDEGINILRDGNLTRRALSQLAKECSVHIGKSDNYSIIETKIVDSVIGSKLNSIAIRGE